VSVEKKKHLYDLLSSFSTAMLVSQAGDSGLHARPMAVAELKPTAEAYFATDRRSPKIAEIARDPNVLVTFQSSSEYASVAGTASVVDDSALIDRLWSETWRVWFPEGKTDPNLVLLKFEPAAGEYWDNSGLEGVKYLFKGLKAVLQGERPEHDSDQHAKVVIRR
jgi:general stress protein 26